MVGQVLDLEDPRIIAELRPILSEALKNEILNGIKHAQGIQNDYFGFGRQVEIADHKAWSRIKDRWDEQVFPEAEFEVTVNTTIVRTGLTITTKIGELYEQGQYN
ncbi:hypothetical protein N752_28475 [Desulforamulus aquiferis]|nr:hypothetical protein N752_28475 [Desulforamulus aquiferis]